MKLCFLYNGDPDELKGKLKFFETFQELRDNRDGESVFTLDHRHDFIIVEKETKKVKLDTLLKIDEFPKKKSQNQFHKKSKKRLDG